MPAGYRSLSTITKPQKGLLNQTISGLSGQSSNIAQNPLFQQVQGYLQNLLSGSPESSKAFEAPAMRQFNEQIIPGLAERFSGAGAQSSSAFQQALGQQGAGLAERLQRMRSELQMGAIPHGLQTAQQPISNLFNFSNLGLNTQAQGYVPKQQPFWQKLLTSGAQGLGAGLSGGGLSGLGGLLGMFGGGNKGGGMGGMGGGNLSDSLQSTGGGIQANNSQSFLDPFAQEYSPFVGNQGNQGYQQSLQSMSPQSQSTLSLLQKILSGAGLF
jgi:hypothetical protein